MKAIEVTATVDEQGQLHLDQPLKVTKSGRVRALLLFPEDDEIEEMEWLKAAASNPVFAFLHDPEEDIYTLEDGKPLDDEG
ncbi:MAG: hypothetical protein RLZZ338_1555 [Cyanobacteriota bacterium]|jgi:hypothetical protein